MAAAYRHLKGEGQLPDPVRAAAVRGGPALPREALEAWLLTGEPDAVVAAEAGVPAAVAGAYHDLFFDVRTRPGDPAVRWAALGGPDPPDPPAAGWVLKHVALTGGPHVLRHAVRQMAADPPAVPKDLRAVPTEELLRLRDWASVRLHVVVLAYRPRTDAEKLRFLALQPRRQEG